MTGATSTTSTTSTTGVGGAVTLASASSAELVRSTITRKAAIAATGVLPTAWSFLHMAGSLAPFSGWETMNGYAALLRESGLCG